MRKIMIEAVELERLEVGREFMEGKGKERSVKRGIDFFDFGSRN